MLCAIPNAGVIAGPRLSGTGAADMWRLVFLSNTKDALSFAEIEMAATAAGADQCSGGTPLLTPSISTQTNATDNNGATFVTSTAVAGAIWTYTFSSDVNVAEVRITARNSSPEFQETPTAFVVQSSADSGTTWTTYAWCLSAAWTTAGQVQSFAVGTTPFVNTRANARAWRLNITAINSGSLYTRCSQLIWATSAGGSQAAAGGQPIVGSNAIGSSDGATANIMFSGDNAHRTGSSGAPWFYGYVWPSVFDAPVECRYRADGISGDLADYPNAMSIQWTADGVTWTTTDTYTGITGWSAGAEKTFAIT